jgi:hypothetical protein
MKLESPILLSECGSTLVMNDEPGKQEQIVIQPGEFLVVIAGVHAKKPVAKFTHSNVAATGKVVHEFKHYRSNGGKFWTSRAGVDFYFIIPRNQIKIIPQELSSYIKAEINGVKVKFNVSGGTVNGWTDWLPTVVSISIGHGVRDLSKLASVAVRGTALEPITPKPLENEESWNQMASSYKWVIDQVTTLAEQEKAPKVVMKKGIGFCGHHEGVAVSVERRRRRVPIIPPNPGYTKSWSIEYTGILKSLVLSTGAGRVRVKANQIDWVATAAANGIGLAS